MRAFYNAVRVRAVVKRHYDVKFKLYVYTAPDALRRALYKVIKARRRVVVNGVSIIVVARLTLYDGVIFRE